MDILNVFFNNPLRPSFIKKKLKKKYQKRILNSGEMKIILILNMVQQKNEFAYDNELPGGEKLLLPYQIECNFVSNNEWKEFIELDGYKRPELWLSDGWDFIQKNNINKPMYWIDDKYQFCLTGLERVDNDNPVSHISYYEADAYCKFKKKKNAK